MKQLPIFLTAVLFCTNVSAQEDTTARSQKTDTLRIGNIIIIKKDKGAAGKKGSFEKAAIEKHKDEFSRKNSKRVTTNWWIVDLGFANYDDQTNYLNTGNYLVANPAPGTPAFSKSDFKLRSGKSVNVNVWLFMQRVNLIKKNVSLKYGLGVELNNYRYKSTSPLSYKEGGSIPYSGGLQTNSPFIFRDSVSFSKNKLAADYLTVPLMLNFSTTPKHGRPTIYFSAGVSAGYLYSQRNKQVSEERGKFKNKGNYDLEKFKFSYVAELAVGPVKVYGSYSPKSMYEHSLDIKPYNFGVRFSNW